MYRGKTFSLNLKTLCENNCIFCRDSTRKRSSKGWDGYDRIDSIMDRIKFASIHGFNTLNFTGSEALNHPYIIDLIKHARRYKFVDIQITTTGRKLKDNYFLNKLIHSGVSVFVLPIYGSNEKNHEAVTKASGSFRDIRGALDNLSSYNISVFLTTIFTKQNLKNIPELTNFIASKYSKMYFKINSVLGFSDSLVEFKKVAPPFKSSAPFL